MDALPHLHYKLIYLLLLYTISRIQYAQPKSNFEMIFSSINCNSSDPHGYLAKLDCYVSKNIKRRTFSIELEFTRDIPEFHINMLIVLPRRRSDFVLLNLTKLNGCELLGNKNQATFVQLGRGTLDRFGNIPHRCPFRGGVLYYIRGFRLDMSLMPAFSFETDMKLWFDFIHEQRKLFQGFIQSHIGVRQSG